MSLKLRRVVILGPECTGKSELAEFLATEFHTVWVEEFARAYLTTLQQPYGPSDLLNIARGQLNLEDKAAARADGVLICDTDLFVIKIWSLFKYGYCDRQILQAIAGLKYDLYLLTYIDIPWEADAQREHPHKRQVLYDMYLNEMRNQPVPFIEIKGARNERRESAIDAIKKLLKQGLNQEL
jgi:NadR type nicotinamide-nucleotide adenylyltransferase